MMAVKGLERFKPNLDPPKDFHAFWHSTLAELDLTVPEIRLEPPETTASAAELRRISFRSLGGARISAYLLRSKSERPCPLIVHAHGYNDRYEVRNEWGRDCHVFGFDARGFGRSAEGVKLSADGYVLTGIESPETSILRGAVADYLQAARVARDLLQGDATTMTFKGFSFGGALSLMAAAQSTEPDLVVLGQPTFGWHAERRRVSLAGSTHELNRYLECYPWRLDRVSRTLEYFESAHFARLVSSPTIVGIGLDDDVVPSRTVLAIVNHLRCPTEIRLLPVSHSNDSREVLWNKFHSEWLTYVIDGIPANFGLEPRQIQSLVA